MRWVGKMTSNQLIKKYLAWWQPRNPRGRLWPNRTGFFMTFDGKRIVPCGLPPPIPKQEDSGGGSDLIGINDGIFVAREIKTFDDTLRKNQADFLSLIKSLGGDVGLILENPYNGRGFDEKIWNDNLRYLVK